jgi:hypothetical protein
MPPHTQNAFLRTKRTFCRPLDKMPPQGGVALFWTNRSCHDIPDLSTTKSAKRTFGRKVGSLGSSRLLRPPREESDPAPSMGPFASYAILRARRARCRLRPIPSRWARRARWTKCLLRTPTEESPMSDSPGQNGGIRDAFLICSKHAGIAHMLLDTIASL